MVCIGSAKVCAMTQQWYSYLTKHSIIKFAAEFTARYRLRYGLDARLALHKSLVQDSRFRLGSSSGTAFEVVHSRLGVESWGWSSTSSPV